MTETTPATALSLTDNERKMLLDVAHNEFCDWDDDGPVGVWVWSDCVGDCFNATSKGGIISSLTKKGALRQSGEKGREACVAITQLGWDAVRDTEA